MLETNVNNFSDKKDNLDLKTETKGYDIREEIENDAIMIIYVQSKTLRIHASKLKCELIFPLKEANDEKWIIKRIRTK